MKFHGKITLEKKIRSPGKLRRGAAALLSKVCFVFSFTDAMDTYLKKAFVKGLPALFKNIKPLYSDPKKVELQLIWLIIC